MNEKVFLKQVEKKLKTLAKIFHRKSMENWNSQEAYVYACSIQLLKKIEDYLINHEQS